MLLCGKSAVTWFSPTANQVLSAWSFRKVFYALRNSAKYKFPVHVIVRNVTHSVVCLLGTRLTGWALQKSWTDRDAVWMGDSVGPKEPCSLVVNTSSAKNKTSHSRPRRANKTKQMHVAHNSYSPSFVNVVKQPSEVCYTANNWH